MAWHGMAWHGMARHGTAWHGMAWHGMACIAAAPALAPAASKQFGGRAVFLTRPGPRRLHPRRAQRRGGEDGDDHPGAQLGGHRRENLYL